MQVLYIISCRCQSPGLLVTNVPASFVIAYQDNSVSRLLSPSAPHCVVWKPAIAPSDVRLLWEDDAAQSSLLIKLPDRGQEVPVGVTLLKNAHVAQDGVGKGTRRGAGRDGAKSAPFEMQPPHDGLRDLALKLFRIISD